MSVSCKKLFFCEVLQSVVFVSCSKINSFFPLFKATGTIVYRKKPKHNKEWHFTTRQTKFFQSQVGKFKDYSYICNTIIAEGTDGNPTVQHRADSPELNYPEGTTTGAFSVCRPKACIMVEEKAKIAAKNTLTAFLEGKQLRKTPERYAILEKVLEINSHFDIMSLYRAMEQDTYHVSRATIYNTMELLVECGLVRKHQFGNRHAQFEKVIDTSNHHHLMCIECGKIKEVKDTELIRYMNSRKYPSFTTQHFALYVYGICNRCARRLKKATVDKK